MLQKSTHYMNALSTLTKVPHPSKLAVITFQYASKRTYKALWPMRQKISPRQSGDGGSSASSTSSGAEHQGPPQRGVLEMAIKRQNQGADSEKEDDKYAKKHRR